MGDQATRLGVGNVLGRDVLCIRCGYNLRGLAEDGVCPEYGSGIALSVASPQDAVADEQWIGRAATGARVYAAALLTGLALMVGATVSATAGLGHSANVLVSLALAELAVVGMIGIWLSTGRSPHHWYPRWRVWCALLRTVSILVAIGAVTFCILQIGRTAGWYGPVYRSLWRFSFGIGGYGMLALDGLYLFYLARLARPLRGSMAAWGYVMAWRMVAVIPAMYVVMVVERFPRAAGVETAMVMAGEFLFAVVVVPGCVVLWPAMYLRSWAAAMDRQRGK